MKLFTVFALIISALLISCTFNSETSAQNGRTPPDVRVLGSGAKLGIVKFSHLDHVTKNRSISELSWSP